MANQDRPRGFEPRDEVLTAKRYVAGGKIAPGELVSMASDGKVDPTAVASPALGVAIGSAVLDEKILVADHPDQQYLVQADGSEINVQTDIGLNYNIVATGDDTIYNISRMELDSSDADASTTASLALRLLGIEDRPDNALGAQVDCVVVINNHQLGKNRAGI